MHRVVAKKNLSFRPPESIFFFMRTNYSSDTVGLGRVPAGGSPRRPRALQSSAAPATGHTRLELPEQARGRSTGAPRARGRRHQDRARGRRGGGWSYSCGSNRRSVGVTHAAATPDGRPVHGALPPADLVSATAGGRTGRPRRLCPVAVGGVPNQARRG